MRTENYKAFSFRLNNKTMERIKKLRIKLGTSYNLLFESMLSHQERKTELFPKNSTMDQSKKLINTLNDNDK